MNHESSGLEALAQKVVDVCLAVSQLSEEPGKITRTYLSAPMRETHALMGAWMEGLGLTTWIDPVGNLRGIRSGVAPGGRKIVIGSHLDTVPDGGAYDGVLGVAIGIALMEALGDKRLPYDVEIVGLSEEEGVRFSYPFIGSKAIVGALTEEDLERTDLAGLTVAQAIRAFGLDPTRLSEMKLTGDVIGFLEFHIEQGPVLDQMGESLAVVTAIAGQTKAEVTFTGRADHAGTTPMNLRSDALTGAAAWISWVETFACDSPGLVATVGKLAVEPGATNVIPGRVTASLDVRHPDDSKRTAAVNSMQIYAKGIGCGNIWPTRKENDPKRNLSVDWRTLADAASTPLDACLRKRLEDAVKVCGRPVIQLPSGAGHDAMVLAAHHPAGMIFLRSPGGLSHCPQETVFAEDVEAALEVGRTFLLDLAVEEVS